MKKDKKIKIILLSILILFLSVSVTSSVFAYGGGGSGDGPGDPKDSDSYIPSNDTERSDGASFDNSENSEEIIKLLEERLANSIRVREAQENLDNAQWWADYTILLDNIFTVGTTGGNYPAGFPISWFYSGIRRGTSYGWGKWTGNERAVEDANNRTWVNRFFNSELYKKSVEMYHRVQEEKRRRGEI